MAVAFQGLLAEFVAYVCSIAPCHLYHSDVFIVDDVTNEVSIPICCDGSVVVDDGCDVVPFGCVALAGRLVVAAREPYGVDAFDDDVGFFTSCESG